MGLINASPILGIIKSYRLLWIGGRFGGHKTSLAYKISQLFLDDGYRLVANNRSVWADDIEKLDFIGQGDESVLKSVVLLDEGGLFFKSSRQIEMIAAYARKMDNIYILPSFFPPTRSAQVVTIQPVFNFKAAGLPLIVYKWAVKLSAFKDSGTFLWWRPNEIYGIYDTKDPGDYAGEIVQWLIEKTEEYKIRCNRGQRSDGLPDLEASSEELLMDAVTGFSEAADIIAAVPLKKRGRRIV